MNGKEIANYIKSKEMARTEMAKHIIENEIENEINEIESKEAFAKYEKIDLN